MRRSSRGLQYSAPPRTPDQAPGLPSPGEDGFGRPSCNLISLGALGVVSLFPFQLVVQQICSLVCACQCSAMWASNFPSFRFPTCHIVEALNDFAGGSCHLFVLKFYTRLRAAHEPALFVCMLHEHCIMAPAHGMSRVCTSDSRF